MHIRTHYHIRRIQVILSQWRRRNSKREAIQQVLPKSLLVDRERRMLWVDDVLRIYACQSRCGVETLVTAAVVVSLEFMTKACHRSPSYVNLCSATRRSLVIWIRVNAVDVGDEDRHVPSPRCTPLGFEYIEWTFSHDRFDVVGARAGNMFLVRIPLFVRLCWR